MPNGVERSGAGTLDFQPSRRWRALTAVPVALAVLALDRLTKLLVQLNLDPAPFTGSRFEADLIPGVVGLRYTQNIGAAFSLGEGLGGAFAVFAVVVAIAIAVYLARTRLVSKVETVGLALVLGGALGNAIDRVAFGYVIDFIATEFIDFPVFNVADIGVTAGVALAFIGFLFLSPASKVDATAELNARDAARRERRAQRACPRGGAPDAGRGTRSKKGRR